MLAIDGDNYLGGDDFDRRFAEWLRVDLVKRGYALELDVRGDEAALGKRTGKDSAHGKLTFPGILGIEESVRRADLLVQEACAALEPLGSRAEALQALAHYVLERNH